MGAHVKTFMDFLQQYIENKGKYPVNKDGIIDYYNYNYIGNKNKIIFLMNFNEKKMNRMLKIIRAREFIKDITNKININNLYNNIKYEIDDNKNNRNEYYIYFNIKSYNDNDIIKQFIIDNKSLLMKYTVRITINDNTNELSSFVNEINFDI